jgi:hypothetical protein
MKERVINMCFKCPKNISDAKFYDLETGEEIGSISDFNVSNVSVEFEKEYESTFFSPSSFSDGITLTADDVYISAKGIKYLFGFDMAYHPSVIESFRLEKIMNRTKNRRIKKKLEKRIKKLGVWY